MILGFNLIAPILFSFVFNLVAIGPLFAMEHQNLDKKLRNAVLYSKLDVVRSLLDQGADPNATDGDGYTALLIAGELPPRNEQRTHKIEICTLLLEKGADVNARCTRGNTALILACWDHSDVELCNLLLKHGADANAKSHYGVTALRLCLRTASFLYGHSTIGHELSLNICKLLLKNNADLEQPVPYSCWGVHSKDTQEIVGMTVLIKAAELKDEELARLFVAEQAARIKVKRIVTLLLCLKNSILKNVLYKERKHLLQPYLRTIYCKPVDFLKIQNSIDKTAYDYMRRDWLNPAIK